MTSDAAITPNPTKAFLNAFGFVESGSRRAHASRANFNPQPKIEIARIAKQLDPKVKIVFGGIGATFLWKHLLKHFKEIDYAVIGEGEYSFLNLIKCIEKHNYKKKGIYETHLHDKYQISICKDLGAKAKKNISLG